MSLTKLSRISESHFTSSLTLDAAAAEA